MFAKVNTCFRKSFLNAVAKALTIELLGMFPVAILGKGPKDLSRQNVVIVDFSQHPKISATFYNVVEDTVQGLPKTEEDRVDNLVLFPKHCCWGEVVPKSFRRRERLQLVNKLDSRLFPGQNLQFHYEYVFYISTPFTRVEINHFMNTPYGVTHA